MSKKVRVGVLGVKRGTGLIDYSLDSCGDKFEVVAICDKWLEGLEEEKKKHPDGNVAFYPDFDEFIRHDMDAVVLANYGNEHAPFAVRCLDRGLHVYSEVTACQNMKEAVELVEAVERSGKIYALAEQYCFMPSPRKMKEYYEAGKLGELELADCEYAHDSSDAWHRLTFGDPNHWRNRAYATFYCTHSIGPILHATGLRPVTVTGYESAHNERRFSVGAKTAAFGVSMITLNNGAIIKALNGNLKGGTLWYAMYGSKGKMESSRSIANDGRVGHFMAELVGPTGRSPGRVCISPAT
ncbi:MAG: Gfo/Idh/MocA family oxidoreductase [Clostridia bacterium]|nr:Gfo/Idh/MocA family oxidoreductase [Clostridia bacterium]